MKTKPNRSAVIRRTFLLWLSVISFQAACIENTTTAAAVDPNLIQNGQFRNDELSPWSLYKSAAQGSDSSAMMILQRRLQLTLQEMYTSKEHPAGIYQTMHLPFPWLMTITVRRYLSKP